MTNRARTGSLVVSLTAYLVFMIAVLGLVGFDVGIVEFAIWLTVLFAGVLLILRRGSGAADDEQAGD